MTYKLLLGCVLCFSISALAQGTKRGPASNRGVRNPAQTSATATTTSTSAAATAGEASELDAMLAPEPFPTPAEKAQIAVAPAKSEPGVTKAKNDEAAAERRAAPTRIVLADPFQPGWKARDFTRALGFSSGLTGSGNAIVIENTPDAESSWAFHFGFNKLNDSFTESNTSSVSGIATTTSTTTLSRSGAKSAATLSFGSSYMSRVFKNDFILVRWGGFGGIDYVTDAKSPVGTRSTSESSATPGTVNITESGFGEQTIKSSPGINFGPVFDASLYLRWFPNISVGFMGGILYKMDRKVTTTTSTVSRTYQTVGGVDQADTSNTKTNVESVQNLGPALSTYALAGQNFNLFGNFVIRYLW